MTSETDSFVSTSGSSSVVVSSKDLRKKAVEAIQSLIEDESDPNMAQSIVDRFHLSRVLKFLKQASSAAASHEDQVEDAFSLWVLLQQVRG